jgi:hypothetical protein
MDYILELRQLVGSHPLILTGATVLILNQENQVLMMRRTDNDSWGVPGGAMELGRPLKIRPAVRPGKRLGRGGRLELFGLQSGPERSLRYANGDEILGACAIYLTREIHGEITLIPVNTAPTLFRPGSLPEKISPPMKPILQDLVKRYRKC